jgi:hypothetical protein
MTRIAALIWVMLGTVLAGSGVLTVLIVPELSEHAGRYIPIAGIGGYAVAIPLALLLAWRIGRVAEAQRR